MEIPIHYVVIGGIILFVGFLLYKQFNKVSNLENDMQQLVGMIASVPPQMEQQQQQAQYEPPPRHPQSLPSRQQSQVKMPVQQSNNRQEQALSAMQQQYGDDKLEEMFS